MSLFKKDLTHEEMAVREEEMRWANEKDFYARRQNIKNEKKAFKTQREKRSTSKLLVSFLFLTCTIVIFFTCWATTKMLDVSLVTGMAFDFTPLVALIGTVVAEVFGLAVYSYKSLKENTVNGIVYEMAMKSQESNEPEVEIYSEPVSESTEPEAVG